MTKWQYYLTLSLEIVDMEDVLNLKGKDRWELINLVEMKVKTGERQRFIAIMKRAKE